jgi:hypothetical protein
LRLAERAAADFGRWAEDNGISTVLPEAVDGGLAAHL